MGKLEGVLQHWGFYIGVVRDDMTEWNYLRGLFFTASKPYEWMFHQEAGGRPAYCDVLDQERVKQCFAGECTIYLDTCEGNLALLMPDGTVAAQLSEPRLTEESSLHFCASMYSN